MMNMRMNNALCVRDDTSPEVDDDMTSKGNNDDDGDEGVKDLIEMTLKKMDHDKDGRVSFGDFEMTVKKDPLMMEAFGPCLPNSTLGNKYLIL